MMEEFSQVQKCDEMLDGFLKQFGLPAIIHSMYGGREIPVDIWQKVEAFQKKGGKAQFDTIVAGCGALAAENKQLLSQIKQIIETEE